MPTRRSRPGSVAGEVLRTWRAPRWARASAIAIALCFPTSDAVTVVNTFSTRTIALAEITGVLGTILCLAITRNEARRPVFAGAAPLSRWGIRVPLSHSGEIAHAILTAARRHAAS